MRVLLHLNDKGIRKIHKFSVSVSCFVNRLSFSNFQTPKLEANFVFQLSFLMTNYFKFSLSVIMFSWQEQYLTRLLRSLVRYCSCHSLPDQFMIFTDSCESSKDCSSPGLVYTNRGNF